MTQLCNIVWEERPRLAMTISKMVGVRKISGAIIMKCNWNNPMVSIVLPMYNCENYLDELLCSLSQQSFTDFEAICVNDGSTDGTERKLKDFCKKDNRFSLITKENGGAGSARNAGLDVARGKYVLFLDADDLYSRDLLKEMVEAAEEHQGDIAICMFKLNDRLLGIEMENRGLYGSLRTNEPEKVSVALPPGDIPNVFRCTNPSPQNKMFKTSFLKDIGLKYPSLTIAEDLVFIYSAISLAERIVGVRKSLLEIRTGHNDGSLTSNTQNHITDAISALQLLYKWLKEHKISEQYKDTFLSLGANTLKYEMNMCYSEEFLCKTFQVLTCEEPWTGITHKQLVQLMEPGSASLENTLKKNRAEMHGTRKRSNASPAGFEHKKPHGVYAISGKEIRTEPACHIRYSACV